MWAFLVEYIALQKGLIESLRDEFLDERCRSVDLCREVDIPQRGEIHCQGAIWSFQRHGAGIVFRESRNQTVVDVHDHFIRLDIIDGWRLRTYLGSLGRRGIKIVDSIVDHHQGTLLERVEELIKKATVQGVIKRVKIDGDYYQLVR